MKKFLVIFMACMMLLLCACGAKEVEKEPVIETRTELAYFVGFGTVNGEHAVNVRNLEASVGTNPVVYRDENREEVLIFAQDAQLKSFDLSKNACPDETSVSEVSYELFKELSLLTYADRRIVFELTIEDGLIKSAVSQLSFYIDPNLYQPKKVICEKCEQEFDEKDYANHVCTAAVTPSPSPSATPAPTVAPTKAPVVTPAPTAAPRTIQCPKCYNWYYEGNNYIYHTCTPKTTNMVQCSACGNWYEEGNIFRNHVCSGANKMYCYGCDSYYTKGIEFDTHYCIGNEDPVYVYCDLCGKWYEEGNVYRNHVCSGADKMYCYGCDSYYTKGIEFDTHYCIGNEEPEYVYCDLCGGWYEEGNVYRNHACSGADKMYCYGCDSYYTRGIEFDTHYCIGNEEPEYVYCDLCGGWYEEGNIFRNHVCSGANMTY